MTFFKLICGGPGALYAEGKERLHGLVFNEKS